MKRFLKIAVSVIVWGAIIAYLVWSSRLGAERRAQVYVQHMNITVADSAEIDIVRPEMVEKMIADAGLEPVGLRAEDVDLRLINETVGAHGFVKDVRTYTDLNGNVDIVITQRRPAMRVVNSAGYDFYITSDGHILPVENGYAHYVPVVTGDFGLPFDKRFSGGLDELAQDAEKKYDKNYLFLYKLINFVNYTEKDDFWRSQIVQINVRERPRSGSNGSQNPNKYPEVELVPRVGDHVAMLGELDGYEMKLEKLAAFYRKGLGREGWNKWNYIDLRFDGQVVCSNRK